MTGYKFILKDVGDETHFSTEQNQTGQKSWISQTNVYKRRPQNYKQEKGKGQIPISRLDLDDMFTGRPYEQIDCVIN